MLPAGSTLTGVQITPQDKYTYPDNYLIRPVQPPCIIGQTCDTIAPNPAIYNSNNPYPAAHIKVLADRYIYGYHLITLQVAPFEYIPASGALSLYRQLNIIIQYTQGTAAYSDHSSLKIQNLNQEFITAMVVNPQDILQARSVSPNPSPAVGATAKQVLHWQPDDVGDQPEYIIITNNALKPYFKILADYKTKRGIPTTIATVEDIYQNYPGVDYQEQIRNYLKNVYDKWGSIYVLLGGDTDIIPARIGTMEKDNEGIEHYWITDLYYSDVYNPNDPNNNWNANGNSNFGWEYGDNYTNINGTNARCLEYVPDNYLGRISVHNENDVLNIMNKIQKYESLNGLNNSYINNLLLVGAYGVLNTNSNSNRGQYWMYRLYNKSYLSTKNKWRLYDDYLTSAYNPFIGDEELSRNSFINRLSNGGDDGYFHIISHFDHGSPYSIGASSLQKSDLLYYSDLASLQNQEYLQIMYTAACEPGQFDKNSFAEQYINASNTAGVAIFANTGFGWQGNYLQQDYLFEAIYLNSINRLSNISNYVKINNGNYYFYNDSYNKNFTLFGDPTMMVWTDTPGDIALTVPQDFSIDNNSVNTFSVQINPINEDALITIYKHNNTTFQTEVYGYRYIAAGQTTADFYLHPDTEGELLITATAKNYLPSTATSQIHMPQAHVYITNVNYTDSNGNNAVEPGETISLEFELTNSGNTDISNISAHLRPDDALVNQISVLQADNTYSGTIASGNTITLDNYQFQYNQNGEMPHYLKFWLDITDTNGYSHKDEFYLNLEQTGLELGMRYITDTNGNIITDMSGLQTGETYHLHIALNNIANIDATGINGSLSSSDTSINITQNQSAYPDIEAHQRQLNTTDFEFVLNQAPNGSLPFNLQATNALGVQQDFSFDLMDNPIPQIHGYDFTSTEDEIKLTWIPVPNIKGYNIYRADSDSNNPADYIKVNDRLLAGSSLYVNTGLSTQTSYYYKISVVMNNNNELPLQLLHTAIDYGNQHPAYKAWTSFSYHTGFPIYHSFNGDENSSPTVADINGDGTKEIFISKNDWDGSTNGRGIILGYDEQGHELFNIDGNTTTLAGFAQTSFSMSAKPAIIDMDGDGNSEVFAIGKLPYEQKSRLYAYHTIDTHSDNYDKPDQVWDTYNTSNGDWNNNNFINIEYNGANHGSQQPPVLADINNDGYKEIIVIDEHQSLHVYDKDQNELYAFQINDTRNDSMGKIAVADIDNDGFKDIIFNIQNNNPSYTSASSNDGAIYRFSPNIQPTPVLIKEFTGEKGDGNLVLADIDGDNRMEILCNTYTRFYALNDDGTTVSGWPASGYLLTGVNGISIGDLNNDLSPEIVITFSQHIDIYNTQGVLVGDTSLDGDCQQEAILADINGDNFADIVVNTGSTLDAYSYDGSNLNHCNGWPIFAEGADFSGSPYIGDIDGDNKNEMIIADKSMGTVLYAWDTPGNANVVEWGMCHFNAQNTNAYKGIYDLDLMIKDSSDDAGFEPNNTTLHYWNSSDIWVRNLDDNGTEHQNPLYVPNQPVYVYVRVTNRSDVSSSGQELLNLYWSKSSSMLSWPDPWTGQYYVNGVQMGYQVDNPKSIPVLQPGESRIIKFEWYPNDPADFTGNEPFSWNYCLLSRIESNYDPMRFSETSNLMDNVRNNNNIALKNVTVINVIPDDLDHTLVGSVGVGNLTNTNQMYYLELLKASNETGNPIFEEAEVKIKMDDILYEAWQHGGEIAQELEDTNDDHKKIVKGDNVILDNLAFDAHELGILTLYFNFLTEKMTDKDKFTYWLIQRDYYTGEIIGGETFIIKKQPRPAFLADADDKEADKGEIVTLSANGINEAAVYNWYDMQGNLIYQGKDLTVTVDMEKKYKLEVIASADGFKDYKEVEVKFKPNRIEQLTPNPANDQVEVSYKINEGDDAYLMFINISGNNNSVGNYVIDVNDNQTYINLSGYSTGVYSVVLVTNGQISDIKELIVE